MATRRRAKYFTATGDLQGFGGADAILDNDPACTVVEVSDSLPDTGIHWDVPSRSFVLDPPPKPRKRIMLAIRDDPAFAAAVNVLPAARKAAIIDALRDFFALRAPYLDNFTIEDPQA